MKSFTSLGVQLIFYESFFYIGYICHSRYDVVNIYALFLSYFKIVDEKTMGIYLRKESRLEAAVHVEEDFEDRVKSILVGTKRIPRATLDILPCVRITDLTRTANLKNEKFSFLRKEADRWSKTWPKRDDEEVVGDLSKNVNSIDLRISGNWAVEIRFDFTEDFKTPWIQALFAMYEVRVTSWENSTIKRYIAGSFSFLSSSWTQSVCINISELISRRNIKTRVIRPQRLTKSILKLNDESNVKYFSSSNDWCLSSSSSLILEEIEFVLDSGASMHMLSR